MKRRRKPVFRPDGCRGLLFMPPRFGLALNARYAFSRGVFLNCRSTSKTRLSEGVASQPSAFTFVFPELGSSPRR